MFLECVRSYKSSISPPTPQLTYYFISSSSVNLLLKLNTSLKLYFPHFSPFATTKKTGNQGNQAHQSATVVGTPLGAVGGGAVGGGTRAGPTPHMGHVGDWVCPVCKCLVFSFRPDCFKCHTLRPDIGPPIVPRQPRKTMSRPDGDVRDGDWLCGACMGHNFADKLACFTCRVVRPQPAAISNTSNSSNRLNHLSHSVPIVPLTHSMNSVHAMSGPKVELSEASQSSINTSSTFSTANVNKNDISETSDVPPREKPSAVTAVKLSNMSIKLLPGNHHYFNLFLIHNFFVFFIDFFCIFY